MASGTLPSPRTTGFTDAASKQDFSVLLVLFDLQSGTWKETKSPALCLSFLGSDEATLAFRKDKGDGMVTVDWFQQPN
jgi:hypothetical protein